VSVSARGFSSVDGRKKVLILVDGMRFNTLEGKTQMAWDTINLSEIERIEVLDGGPAFSTATTPSNLRPLDIICYPRLILELVYSNS
jgi:hypothetical protein